MPLATLPEEVGEKNKFIYFTMDERVGYIEKV